MPRRKRPWAVAAQKQGGWVYCLEQLSGAHHGGKLGAAKGSHAKDALELALQPSHVCECHGCATRQDRSGKVSFFWRQGTLDL